MSDYSIEEAKFPKSSVLRTRVKDTLRTIGRHIGALYRRAGTLGLRPAGSLFAIYHEKPENPESVDYELCLPVKGEPAAMRGLGEIGGDTCLRIVYRGPYKGLSGVYDALGARIEDENRTVLAPPREVYVRGPFLGFLPLGLVTEVWFPVSG